MSKFDDEDIVVKKPRLISAESSKVISIRVKTPTLEKFEEINRKMGQNNNFVLNALILDYITKNKDILEE